VATIVHHIEKRHSILGSYCVGDYITIPYGAHRHNAEIQFVLGNHHSGFEDGSNGEKESDNVKKSLGIEWLQGRRMYYQRLL